MGTIARATLTSLSTEILRVSKPKALLWLVAAGALTAMLVLLTMAINDGSVPSKDQTVLDWVVGRDLPMLDASMTFIGILTSNFPAMGLGIVTVIFLWLKGLNRAALGVGIVGGIISLVAFLGDYTLGEIVGRSRPVAEKTELSYPSGHVFGSTVFFGFWAFLAIHYKVKRQVRIPLLIVLSALILAVGFDRMFERAHWPSDVAAGYLLGGLWLMLLIPFFLYFERLSWISFPNSLRNQYSRL